MKLGLYFAFILLNVGQNGLTDLEARAKALNADPTWTLEKNEKRDQVNQDLLKLLDADSLKTGEEFRRAAGVLQFVRGGMSEARTRYELAITAVALGDADAANLVKNAWDQFLLGTGRRQHLGSMKAFQGLQEDKYAVTPTAECVKTVLDDPLQARKDVQKLTSNPEIRKLVEEDQKVRQGDWSKLSQKELIELSRADDARRKRLRELLKGIKLMTAQDYHDAALVMQHGSWFDDYALAHELSLCSTILDAKIGRSMVAVSYDRMLESAGYLQRFGTQYNNNLLGAVDTSGFNDTMRKAFGRLALKNVPKKIS